MSNVDKKLTRFMIMAVLFVLVFSWCSLVLYYNMQLKATTNYIRQMQEEQQRREEQQQRILQYQRSLPPR